MLRQSFCYGGEKEKKFGIVFVMFKVLLPYQREKDYSKNLYGASAYTQAARVRERKPSPPETLFIRGFTKRKKKKTFSPPKPPSFKRKIKKKKMFSPSKSNKQTLSYIS